MKQSLAAILYCTDQGFRNAWPSIDNVVFMAITWYTFESLLLRPQFLVQPVCSARWAGITRCNDQIEFHILDISEVDQFGFYLF